ncbi:hypothetical protein BDW02DRAFT_358782 [Decorospora gaudefroyi]|uniref:Uncharacterized protein n=1 Tax=Decorospora gaudefroyi TaxID=184978 RepID=A0A6A5K941_9PLEO|nr:hypothetical protein BDW02DRAFT_358782 [Decorospora gaudefroyi]
MRWSTERPLYMAVQAVLVKLSFYRPDLNTNDVYYWDRGLRLKTLDKGARRWTPVQLRRRHRHRRRRQRRRHGRRSGSRF